MKWPHSTTILLFNVYRYRILISVVMLLLLSKGYGQGINANDRTELLLLYHQQTPAIKLSLSNWNSDSFPWEGVDVNPAGRVVALSLPYKKLSGVLPNFNLPYLEVLQLSFNQLTGAIPSFDLPQLKTLSLFNNYFNGSIPHLNTPILEKLQLSGNNLSGNIPQFGFSKLTVLFYQPIN
ncbi:leucine-rich repeat domain-containing protein [Niabella ginsengisoli]|uniref:Leucine-rich repeat domain-containing protein n=1 Tax=Niabella ginsengisoli TaxID=522298 RepID=A0ABS9SHW5_9BACT|nr:leucine-rich repeat domain-containing protein [Niabella ginsengisoli]MCH5597961.1 leucine-rich repeat domain-containing protein [Niabella ginsengisoli]